MEIRVESAPLEWRKTYISSLQAWQDWLNQKFWHMKIIIQEIDNVSPPCEPPSHQVPPTTTKEFSNTVEDETEPGEEDEFDLYPDVLELPPLRSPRGSINSIYGSSRNGSRHGSRHGSNCSQVHFGQNIFAKTTKKFPLSQFIFILFKLWLVRI